MIGDYEGPSVPFNPSHRRDDGRSCPGPGLARLPRDRDATPEERFETARRTPFPFGPSYRYWPLDDIGRSDEGLLFLDEVRRVRIPGNASLKWLWNPLCAFLGWPEVAEALQVAKDRLACKTATAPPNRLIPPWEW